VVKKGIRRVETNIIEEAKTISIILPTRGRPENLKRMINSILITATYPENIEMCFRVDSDDIESIKTLITLSEKININIKIGTKYQCHGYYWNEAWEMASNDVLQMSGDDFVYHTKGWDVEVLKEINKYDDKMVMVYGRDGIQEGKLATHHFMHRRWHEAIGQFVQLRTKVFYHDTGNDVLATKIGRRCYRSDLYFEHLHWTSKKSELDSVGKYMRTKSGNDNIIWESKENWDALEEEAKKLRKLLKGYNMKKTLSVLVPSLTQRLSIFLELLKVLQPQITDEVELLINADNGKKSIGQKRNELLESAKGKYVAFVDDDDLVSENYVSLILDAVKNDCDVVGMHLLMTRRGNPDTEERTYHSLKYRTWYDEPDPDRKGKKRYFRNPNHLNPVKREFAIQIKYPTINHGEDLSYSKRLLPLLNTESYIEQPIYYYRAEIV
jgi:glycosyltransferase involved in cell wall biosynthesis